eukprot:scaffold102129_cov38-Cyclotella_meneghiniana.AAC.2
MDKTDNTILTNQPETGAIPPLISSRVVGCLGVVEKAVFDAKLPAEMDESEIFVFGRVGDGGAKFTEVEAAMTPAVLRMMALGTGRVVTERGRSNSR